MTITVKGDFSHKMFAFNHLELETLFSQVYAGPGFGQNKRLQAVFSSWARSRNHKFRDQSITLRYNISFIRKTFTKFWVP